MAFVYGWLLLGETPTLIGMAGAAVIVAGAITVNMRQSSVGSKGAAWEEKWGERTEGEATVSEGRRVRGGERGGEVEMGVAGARGGVEGAARGSEGEGWGVMGDEEFGLSGGQDKDGWGSDGWSGGGDDEEKPSVGQNG